MIKVRVRYEAGRVVMVITAPSIDCHTAWSMTPDEARDLCNGLGAAIQGATTAKVTT